VGEDLVTVWWRCRLYRRVVAGSPWQWDETLYRGSAVYYAAGRLPYPPAMAQALRSELSLDGHGRLLDVGCGPGSAALLLAPLFEEAVGVDADPDMIAEARGEAARRGMANTRWVHMRAEELPADLGRFRVATFAQSFHWMDRPRVAAAVRDMLEPGGAWVHVNATTHRGVETDAELPAPAPPRDEIAALVHRYLGPQRRAGRSVLHRPVDLEDDVMAAAGFAGPDRIPVPRGDVHERTEDEVVASVYSLSSAAPHLFGERLPEFDADLRRLLRAVSSEGRFAEKARDIELLIWHAP
jgi:SAM-dependent methyltransferase